MTIATDQGFPQELARATPLQGWALAEQGQVEEGISQIRQGLATRQAVGASLSRFNFCLQRLRVRGFAPGVMEISYLKTAISAHFSLPGN